jgi:putative transcriptional regulator
VAPDTDWRAFRAQLVASASGGAAAAHDEVWAHAIPTPERGCLLLASPLMFLDSQTYFSQAVILILSHDAAGSVGVIINK